MKFDRDKFFAAMRSWSRLNQSQVDGLSFLLDSLEADAEMSDVRWISYVLATVKHEAAGTYKPIAEFGKGKGKPYGKKDPETGQVYYGRGFVQITHRDNYETMGNLLDVDLVNEPDLALDPEIAYRILSLGMREGLFTGRRLSHYIYGTTCDYVQARRIVNELDKADLIAGYARRFQTILDLAQAETPVLEPAPIATATTETVKTTVVAETPTGTKTEETSLVSKIAANEQVKVIASEGVTKLATKATTALGTASTATATGGAATGKTWLIVLSIVLAVGVIAVLLFLLWHKSEKEKQVAVINSDRDRTDVKFTK